MSAPPSGLPPDAHFLSTQCSATLPSASGFLVGQDGACEVQQEGQGAAADSAHLVAVVHSFRPTLIAASVVAASANSFTTAAAGRRRSSPQ
jgi:hypothetical protein